MRELVYTTAFRKDYKFMAKNKRHDISLFKEIVAFLANDLPLDGKYRDHALSGNWNGYRECHIKPDWLLIYKLETDSLILARTGSHAKLFG